MKTDIIQTSFAGGEFGPQLFGRTDIAQYQNACEIVENFLVRPYGPVISAPGSRYVATVSDSTLKTRLIQFVFNKTDAYVIEMGDLYMRFFTSRGQVVDPDGSEDLSAFTANLITHYKMNDNTNSTIVIDSDGSHNGTSSTLTSSLHTAGKVGTGSFDFDARYDVEIPNHSEFNFSDTTGTNKFSVAGWVYFVANGQGQYFVSKSDTSKIEWISYFMADGRFALILRDELHGQVDSTIQANNPVTTGWHFVCFTYNGVGGSNAAAGMNLYIDGEIVTDVTRATNSGYQYFQNNTAPVMIGARYETGTRSQWFNDKIDNVAIFNKELTAAEVITLYTSTPYQITTVFTEDEISDVQFTQLNDIIWLAHPNHPPQRLVRTSANEWAISDYAFLGGPFLDDNTDTGITITPSATIGTINLTVSPTNSSIFTLSSGTLGHHNVYWKIGGLSQTNTTTGLQEEGYVKITHVINSYTATATVIKNLKVSTATAVWAEGAWSSVRGYPSRVNFHESRLWFARTSEEPQKVWGSKVFEFDAFSLDTEADDDALNLALASNESNEIQWLASGKNLIAGTFGGAFVINSGSTEPITPANASASEEVGYGSEPIQPKKAGNFIYYVQRFGKKLREMFYVWDLDTYKAVDRTILSPHILSDGIADLAVQQNPETILYCVLADGTLATMTREVDQEVTAWARHTTAGTYTSIAIIPSQTEDYDEAWVIVERWINSVQKKYVEFFENIKVPDRQDQCLYLHSALTYDAYETSGTSSTTISLSAASGSVTLTASTSYFATGAVGKRIRAIDADGNTLGQGQITATASTTSITLSITTTFNALSYAVGRWGLSVASVAGLSHLEAKTIGILADGITESLTRTVASGVVTLGSNYFVVTVGLSYDQVLYTLPKEAGTQRGTAQGKLQRFNEVAFKVNRSTQNFKYGPDADHLDDVNLAVTPTVTTLYTGIIPPQGGGIAMRGGYKRGAQIYIKNSNPLPIELLSIIGTLDTNEK